MKVDESYSGLIDITQPVGTGIPVWPGDTEYHPYWVMQMDQGDSCNVGSATMSMHTGTHADAPMHFQPDGLSVADVSLDAYVGTAMVVDAVGAKKITPDLLDNLPDPIPPRLLFRTRMAIPASFDSDFCYLSTDAVRILVQHGVKLIGMDTPSVDSFDSKRMESHNILCRGSVAILENLALQHVAAGVYELIALPLRLSGMDASPVRAVLRVI